MTVAVEAVYEDGVLKLEKPVPFKEHAKVRVTIEEDAAQVAAEADDPTGWKALRSIAGIVKDSPSDVSENHDKYLYGEPAK